MRLHGRVREECDAEDEGPESTRCGPSKTASDLWRITMLIALTGGVLEIMGLRNFWAYFPPCGPG